MLKIDVQIIEEKLVDLPFESNIKNKKYQLLNIGEDNDLTPNKDMFFNFLIISVLLFFVLLAIYNSSESKSRVLTNYDLITQVEKIRE